MITSEGGTLNIGDVTVTVTRHIKPKIEGIIQMAPGAISSLITFHTNPNPDVSPYFIRVLFGLDLIEPTDPKTTVVEVSFNDPRQWQLTPRGSAYIDFITGK